MTMSVNLEQIVALDSHQTEALWSDGYTHVRVGTHTDGTPAFVRLEVPQWDAMLKEAAQILAKGK